MSGNGTGTLLHGNGHGILRQPPPRISQTLTDSCWAAVLESWSKVDSRIAAQTQATMIQTFGEGATGGITPTTKIPALCSAFGLQYRVFVGSELQHYLQQHLAHSYVFCAYRRETFAHAVLIYRLSGRSLTHVSYMDPDGGYHRWHSTEWFSANGPMVVMRK